MLLFFGPARDNSRVNVHQPMHGVLYCELFQHLNYHLHLRLDQSFGPRRGCLHICTTTLEIYITSVERMFILITEPHG